MKRTVLGFFVGTLATICMVQTRVSVARAGLVVGSFDSAREDSNFDGPNSQQARASLLSHFPGTSLVTAPTLTPAFLAGLDELVITSASAFVPTGVSPLSASEQSAMLNYVLAGGSVFVIADGFAPFVPSAQSMVGPFGLTIVDDNLSGLLPILPSTHAHPVINGPFGDTSTIVMVGAGVFTDLGPAVSLALNANHQSVLAVIESHALGPNSGRVVMITDSTPFADGVSGGFFGVDEALFLNTIQYLAPVPEPGGLILAAIAGGGALFAVAQKRRRQAR